MNFFTCTKAGIPVLALDRVGSLCQGIQKVFIWTGIVVLGIKVKLAYSHISKVLQFTCENGNGLILQGSESFLCFLISLGKQDSCHLAQWISN